ncbi:uncharacterized protein RCO7_05252 [Rhynchosporium graminicola]|uniref:PET127 n=1 Tax=Rhynchosporium graminicola TaxID=2792576 RepID=A0A1E1LS86_9HELO|nr:uncharacterized protein RCO7_05252 [Rhynchosporium commune]
MFSTISRGISRVRKAYTCSSCRCNIQANGYPQQAPQQRLNRATRAALNGFSTSSQIFEDGDVKNNDEGNKSLKGKKDDLEPATGDDLTPKLKDEPKGQERGRTGVDKLTPLSRSMTTLRALRDSLLSEPMSRWSEKAPIDASAVAVRPGLATLRRKRKRDAASLRNRAEGSKSADMAKDTQKVDGSGGLPSDQTLKDKLPPGKSRGQITRKQKASPKAKASSSSTVSKSREDRSLNPPVVDGKGRKSIAPKGPLDDVQQFLNENPSLRNKVKIMNKQGPKLPIQQRIEKLLEDDSLSEAERLQTLRTVVNFRQTETWPRLVSTRSKVPRSIANGKGLVRRINSTEDEVAERPGVSVKAQPGTTAHEIKTVDADSLQLVPLDTGPLKVPQLSYGLERVLFNPGVYQLQDPRSRVFNFDPYLQTIMPVSEFDFNALKQYVTSSRDKVLISKAIEEKKKYTGSTSSTTSALAHFHFLLSQWREITTSNLSKMFPVEFRTFTAIQRTPTSIFLRWRDGAYAIDADKQYDTANILMSLGKSMEKLLTLPTDEFERYRKSNPEGISEEERNAAEEFHYTGMGDFLLRSQLDAHDSRLPGTGMFDLKTRAVVSVRMDADDYVEGQGYEIRGRHGEWESFEREYYDMIRSAFLKYSLQVRMGRMDGIFVAFHNTERIFGFQYISLPEMDFALHGTTDTTLGDQEFKLSLDLLNRVLDRATAKYPKQSIRLLIETRPAQTPFTYIFAEPFTEAAIEKVQETNKANIEKFEKAVLGVVNRGYSEEDQQKEWDKIRAAVDESVEHDEAGREASGGDLDTSDLDSDLDNGEDNEDLAENEDDSEEDDLLEEDELADAVSTGESQEFADGDEVVDEDAEGDDQETDLQESEAEEQEIEDLETAQGEGAEMTDIVQPEDVQDLADLDDSVEVDQENEDKEVEAQEPFETAKQEADSSEEKDVSNLRMNTGPAITEDESIDMNRKPGNMMAMTLTIKNKVNGRYVERPKNLTSDDKWSVEYALSEIKNQESVARLYEMAKKRREAANVKTIDMSKDSFNNEFLQRIKAMNEKGREWRKKQSEIDQQTPTKTLNVKDGEKVTSKDHGLWTEDGNDGGEDKA